MSKHNVDEFSGPIEPYPRHWRWWEKVIIRIAGIIGLLVGCLLGVGDHLGRPRAARPAPPPRDPIVTLVKWLLIVTLVWLTWPVWLIGGLVLLGALAGH